MRQNAHLPSLRGGDHSTALSGMATGLLVLFCWAVLPTSHSGTAAASGYATPNPRTIPQANSGVTIPDGVGIYSRQAESRAHHRRCLPSYPACPKVRGAGKPGRGDLKISAKRRLPEPVLRDHRQRRPRSYSLLWTVSGLLVSTSSSRANGLPRSPANYAEFEELIKESYRSDEESMGHR